MSYRRLYFLVEGSDDELYLNQIIFPRLLPYYEELKCWKYAVIPEIESWYIAGLGQQVAEELKVKIPKEMERVDKVRFNQLVPMRMSPIEFRMKLLEHYELLPAVQKSPSLARLVDTFRRIGRAL